MVPANLHFSQARIATAGDLTAGRVLGGMTAQQWPVVVMLSGNGRHMGARAALVTPPERMVH